MQLLYVAGHLAAALVSSFGAMLAIRVITSIGAALFTAQAAGTAALLVAPEKRGSAIAFVFLGMAGFGLTGVLGNVLSARFVDRLGPHNVVLAAILSMTASHLLWPWTVGALPLLALSLFLWGIGSFAAQSAQQARLSALAPQFTSVSIAMNSSALYLGQAVGTGIGGLMLAATPGVEGYRSLVMVSVPVFLLAIALSVYVSRPAIQRLALPPP